MIKVLYNLQLSAIDKKTGEFVLDKDSNFFFCINLIRALNSYGSQKYKHSILVPDKFLRIPKERNVKYISSKNYITKIFSSRFNWNTGEMNKILLQQTPDIIFENNPTLVNNWKVLLLENDLIDRVKVITYNHWIDSNEFPKIDRRCPYSIRQVEGLYLSDFAFCNSRFAMSQWKNTSEAEISFSNNLPYKNNLKIFPPILIENDYKKERMRNNDVVRIIYNHRISSMEYYKSGYLQFLQVLEAITFKKEVEVIFTDASSKLKSRNDIKLKDKKNLKIILKNKMGKKEYIQELIDTDICVATFLAGNGGAWSISLAEGILTNNAVIVPSHSGYKEMIPDNFAWKFTNIFELKEKLKTLVDNRDLRIENNEKAKNFYLKNFNEKILVDKFESFVN